MAVTLPSSPGPASATPRLIDWGSDQVPVLGGPSQRINRLGSRHAVDFQMPPMPYADAMSWIQRLKRAKSDRALMEFPQPGLSIGSPGAPLVSSAHAGGTSLSIRGLAAGYQIREGQFLSIIHGARRYLHSADAAATASATGTATIAVTPMLRVPLADGETIELAEPKIEGILAGDEIGWTIDAARHVGLSFTIVEAE